MDKKLFLEALNGEETVRAPFWFMRQAGRYLPEYKALRAQAKHFLDFCYTPDMACEATLQPIRRFGMDAAIIFSDILVIPDALGMQVEFREGVGPVLEPVRTLEGLARFDVQRMPEHLAPVYSALRKTRAGLPEATALIGFAGAPWTLACYMVEGKGSRDFQTVRSLALTDPIFFNKAIELLTEAVIRHACSQIEAGAEAIQLFDSWAGVLSEDEFARWVIQPTKIIVSAIRARHPGVPLIGFPRQAGCKYGNFQTVTQVNAVSIDASVPLAWAKNYLQPACVVQGNLDPVLLAADKEKMLAQAKNIRAQLSPKNFANKHFVFNLGHGILPHTPLENAQALCDLLREVPA